ncbi:T9SS C-terminal target domain-containing protein [Chryseobacterium indologenes]|nr:T9SS type A sorting domain-containing protein [Chryseobacterium indologenes]AYZ35880.1 T9SS C-terminal target domain-containing protein [Chryseobacterium indologenes]MBF6644660.1 T9SS type A sorting domain-containing protein [Chryseobacterium indologenes]MEB4759655.1 T9SS type A sorting domain-containing protein [Chryseobacterium indologenes]QQQ71647.1 T9SS type A sorting domain-containing protein [Chryseobacterium indologenes]
MRHFLLLAFFSAGSFYGQSGQVDLTFGTNGVRYEAPTGSPNIQVTNDGKVFLMVNNQIKKLNSNGTLDSTFGNTGVFSNANPYKSIYLYSNGKLLTQEENSLYTTRVKRLNSNGSVDTTFGTSPNNGIDFSNSSCSPCIEKPNIHLSNDNSTNSFFILASDGYYMGGRGVVVLKNETGTSGFSISPVYIPAITGSTGIHMGTGAAKILKASDGNYFVGGGLYKINNNSGVSHRQGSMAFVAKYNSQGGQDNNFNFYASKGSDSGSNGGVDYQLDAQDNLYVMAVDNSYSSGASLYYYRIYKTDKYGNLDYSFGNTNFTGYLNVSAAFSSITAYKTNFRKMFIQPDGKILLAGNTTYVVNSTTTQNKEILLARFNTDGTLDSTFGTNGYVVHDIDPASFETFIDAGTNADMTEIYVSANLSNPTDNIYKTAVVKFKNTSANLSTKEGTPVKQDAQFYPNPVKDILKFNTEGKVTVYDMNGKLVLSKDDADGKKGIDVSGLTPGNYLIQIKNAKETINSKFIKN